MVKILKNWFFLFLGTLLVCLSPSVKAQNGGLYTVDFYFDQVTAETRCYAVNEDENGNMIFAVRQGVVLFDGKDWEKVTIPSIPKVFHKHDGKTFIGCSGGFGYLELNNYQHEYVSISEEGSVLDITSDENHIYFLLKGKVVVYDLQKLKLSRTILAEHPLVKFVRIGDEIGYIEGGEVFGIKEKKKLLDINVELDGKLIFAVETNSGVLLGTGRSNLYLEQGGVINPIELKTHDYLQKSVINGAIKLSDDEVALSTLAGGTIILNVKTSESAYILNYQTGLPDDEITALYLDKHNALWLGHEYGATRVAWKLPVNNYNVYPGIEGNITGICFYKNRLYVGTTEGLFYLDEVKSFQELIKWVKVKVNKPVNTTPEIIENFEAVDSDFEPKEDEKKKKKKDKPKKDKKKKDKKKKNKKGEKTGIFKKVKNKFKKDDDEVEEEVVPIEEELEDVVEEVVPIHQENKPKKSYKKAKPEYRVEKRKEYALQSISHVFRRVDGIDGKCTKLLVTDYGLMVGSNLGLFEVADTVATELVENIYVLEIQPGIFMDKVYVGCKDGLMILNHNTGAWEAKSLKNDIGTPVNSIMEEHDGVIWIGGDGNALLVSLDKDDDVKEVEIYEFDSQYIEKVLVRKVQGVMYFFLSSGIFYYDHTSQEIVPGNEMNQNWLSMNSFIASQPEITWLNKGEGWTGLPSSSTFSSIAQKHLFLFQNINHVYMDYDETLWVVDRQNHIYRLGKDLTFEENQFKLLFKWIKDGGSNYLTGKGDKIAFDNKSLTFAVSAPEFIRPEAVMFQYKIEGLMDDWTDWTSSNSFSIPYLPVGKHKILIRAKNIYGDITPEETIEVTILAPYYESWWFISLVVLVAIILVVLIVKFRMRTLRKRNVQLEEKVKNRTLLLEQEKQKSEELLLNILPVHAVDELKDKGNVEAHNYGSSSVLFSDFQGFTSITAKMAAKDVIRELDESFLAFDDIIEKYGIEKIKTIGDAYMCVSGLPIERSYHALVMALVAIEMREFQRKHREEKLEKYSEYWNIRIGINSGPVVAGIIGKRKFAYDIWGDTVNTASRMESNSVPGEINISGATYDLIKDYFDCTIREDIEVKGKGKMVMYFLHRINEEYAADKHGCVPNEKMKNLIFQ